MQDTQYDVIIIGGGPAGYTAGLYSARGALRTVILERVVAGGQMANTKEVDNYPGVGVGIGGFALGDAMKQQAEEFGAETKNCEVTAVELDGDIKKVTLDDGGVITARAVILAMGASPKLLGAPGEKEFRGRGVSYCATCDGMFFRKQPVAVVGGGNTAVEDALLLSKTSSKVYLIHRRDTFRATPLYVELAKKTENIELVLCDNVAEIIGDSAVTGIRLESGREIECAGVFIAVGNQPNTALVQDMLTLDDGGYIPAGETTQTELPGVFAAGDLRAKVLRQIITAAADGAVAATMAEKYLLEQGK